MDPARDTHALARSECCFARHAALSFGRDALLLRTEGDARGDALGAGVRVARRLRRAPVTTRRLCCLSQSRCLDPLLSTIFQRLWASAPPLPLNSTGDPAPDALPPDPRPDTKVSIGSRQLSRTELQLVPDLGAEAVANTPCARLSEP